MDVVNKTDCCSLNSASVAYSHKNISANEFFMYEYLKQGAPDCQRCHTNCSTVVCPVSEKCVMREKYPECVCDPQCDKEMIESGIVCGTDLKTYSSICKMRHRNCGKGDNVEVDYKGVCQNSCDKMKCPFKKYCIYDQNKLPHCINCSNLCSSSKTTKFHEICGTDNITYPNLCSIKYANCFSHDDIEISYEGPCRTVSECGMIKCSHQHMCVEDLESTSGFKCMDCKVGCPKTNITICGTNMKTYSDWCDMRDESCKNRVRIKTLHPGPCKNRHIF
ncbi:unnamed protein product [Gordionus sp. m RMFG-2023]